MTELKYKIGEKVFTSRAIATEYSKETGLPVATVYEVVPEYGKPDLARIAKIRKVFSDRKKKCLTKVQ